MFAISGTRKFSKTVGRSNVQTHCPSCGGIHPWVIVSSWTWFTLFFIPLFPVRHNWEIHCKVCGGAAKPDKESRAAILRGTLPFAPPPDIPQREQRRRSCGQAYKL